MKAGAAAAAGKRAFVHWVLAVSSVLMVSGLLGSGRVEGEDGSSAAAGGTLLRSVFRLGGVAVLTMFIPVSAASFYHFRLPRKRDEYDNIVQTLQLDRQAAPVRIPTIKNEYSAGDYAVPVAFATLVTFVGSMTLILGEDIRVTATPTLLFSSLPCPSGDHQVCHTHYLLVLSMAFLGAYVWALQSLFRRLVTVDLPPGAYYGAGIRMIVAAMIALLFAYLPLEKPLPVIAFLCGIFPDQALQYVKSYTKIFNGRRADRADDLPLEMIEGISMFHKSRLNEVGIDNAQNLSEANLIELLVRTPFKAPLLIDWIAQAKLYVACKSDISKLRDVGVRTVLDLRAIGEKDERLQEIAEAAKVSATRLRSVYLLISQDPGVEWLRKAGSAFTIVQAKADPSGAGV